jgi:hypothetical protein
MPSIGISSYAIGAAPPVISDLTLTGSTSTLSEIVLDVHAGLTLNRVRVAASAGAGDEFHYGIQAVGAAPLIVNNSSIEVSGASVEGIASAGPTTVQLTDTRVSALGLAADSQVGAEVLGALIGKRVSFTGLDRSIHAPSSSSVELDDSLVVTSNDPDSTSIWSGADLKLRGVTLAGTTTDQVGITVGLGAGVRTALIEDSVIDLDPAAQQFDCNGTTTMTIKNTLLDLTDFNDAAVSCGATALMLIDGAIHPPLFVDSAAGNYRPTAASPVVDSGGDDAAVPGRTDLDGNARYLDGNGDGTAIIDLGAYEYQPVGGTPPGPPIGAGTPAATPLTIKFGKAVGKFKIAKKRPKGFALTTAKKKPRLPIHLNVAGTIVITLAKNKGKTLKGSQTFSLPAGDSYLKFTGKWNKKKLAAGKYVVSAAPAKQPRDITKSPLKLAL